MPALTLASSTAPSTRDQVLAAALHLFTGHGYFNTSVHDIGKEAGVSIGSIYHHFKDKEGIAKALFERMVDRMATAFEGIEAAHSSTHDRCRAVVELLFRITTEEPEVMTYMLHAQHREFLPSGQPVCSSKPFTQMRAMVHTGIRKGEIRKMDPMVAASALFGGPLRLISLQLDGILERPLNKYLDEMWDASWHSVSA